MVLLQILLLAPFAERTPAHPAPGSCLATIIRYLNQLHTVKGNRVYIQKWQVLSILRVVLVRIVTIAPIIVRLTGCVENGVTASHYVWLTVNLETAKFMQRKVKHCPIFFLAGLSLKTNENLLY